MSTLPNGGTGFSAPWYVAEEIIGGDSFDSYAVGTAGDLSATTGGFTGSWLYTPTPTINSVAYGGVEDRRIFVGGKSIARMFSFGTSWTNVRLGIRFNMVDSGANLNPLCHFGIMSNPNSTVSNGPAGASCSNYFGYSHNDFTDTRTGGGVPYYFLNGWYLKRKIGNTFAAPSGGSFPGNGWYCPVDSASRRIVLIIELQKVSGFICLANFIIHQSSTNFNDFSVGMFRMSMAEPSLTNARDVMNFYGSTNEYGVGGSTVTTQGIAYNEGVNGPLNAAVFAWDHATGCNISDFAVRKIS